MIEVFIAIMAGLAITTAIFQKDTEKSCKEKLRRQAQTQSKCGE